jgi:hypothetical protein
MIGMREILNEGEKCEKVRERERERLTRMGMGSSAREESSKLFLPPIFLQEATD